MFHSMARVLKTKYLWGGQAGQFSILRADLAVPNLPYRTLGRFGMVFTQPMIKTFDGPILSIFHHII